MNKYHPHPDSLLPINRDKLSKGEGTKNEFCDLRIRSRKVTAILLDGKKLSAEIRIELKAESERLKVKGVVPGLAGILVGEDPGSATYIGLKSKACEETGVKEMMRHLPENATGVELLDTIQKLNSDNQVHGIFVQLPLPKHLAAVEAKALALVVPEKDVDGFHTINVGAPGWDKPPFSRRWLSPFRKCFAVIIMMLNIKMSSSSMLITWLVSRWPRCLYRTLMEPGLT